MYFLFQWWNLLQIPSMLATNNLSRYISHLRIKQRELKFQWWLCRDYYVCLCSLFHWKHLILSLSWRVCRRLSHFAILSFSPPAKKNAQCNNNRDNNFGNKCWISESCTSTYLALIWYCMRFHGLKMMKWKLIIAEWNLPPVQEQVRPLQDDKSQLPPSHWK